jgi:hypothetical protein
MLEPASAKVDAMLQTFPAAYDVLSTIPRRPETDANIPATITFSVLGVLIAAGFIGYGVKAWVRDGNRIPAYFLTGGLLATLFEPLLDLAAGVWYPARGGIVAFEAAGTRIPIWVPLYYIWIIGGQAWVCWRVFERRSDARTVWKWFGFVALVDVATESFGVPIGAYGYFGNQPLNPYGFPLWYAVVNAAAPMLAGALFHVMRPALPERRHWMLILTVPVGWGMACAGAGFPVWMSLHSDWPLWAAHIACAVTFGLAYFTMVAVMAITRTPGYQPNDEQQPVAVATAPVA